MIGSILGTINYTAATGVFQADSLPLLYTSNYTINNPNWMGPAIFDLGYSGTQDVSINLVLNPNGTFKSNGSGFSISGALDLDGDGTDDVAGTLLTGAFKSTPISNPFSFDTSLSAIVGVDTITGGALTQNINLSGGGPLFGGFTVGTLGIFDLFEIQATSGTFGDFTHDFSATFGKDTEGEAQFVPPPTIPEPSSFALALVGLAALGTSRRWSRFQVIAHFFVQLF